MLRRLVVLLGFAVSLPAPALGVDYVDASGRLSDEDFYRAVACGAPPGGRCQQILTKWSPADRGNLTVSVTVSDPDFPDGKRRQIVRDLDRAIAELNGSGADIHLARTDKARADIRVYLVGAPVNSIIRGTGNPTLDGGYIEAALTSIIWQTTTGRMESASIAFSRGILPGDIRSVVLEELTQSLGVIFDIRDSYYNTRSIFSEDGNSVIRISGQDETVLRMHYPPK
ncbi:MAG TPA: DUF2927 domain-containing protein [Devosia sp.]|nr:DUF2927 domain-containing protein [Devosia sp.]